jgi:DNA polymerase V
MLLDLSPANAIQGSLFAAPDTVESQARMRALDVINRRYGRGTLIIGAAGVKSAWRLRRDHVSKNYTTSWSELLTV